MRGAKVLGLRVQGWGLVGGSYRVVVSNLDPHSKKPNISKYVQNKYVVLQSPVLMMKVPILHARLPSQKAIEKTL